MSIVPMYQTITVTRGSSTLDDWGNVVPESILTLKCRITEGSFVTTSRSQLYVNGITEVCKAKILLNGLVDIRYTDIISYTDELGQITKATPKEVNIRRIISGKPVLTEVLV
jgi:hypothetical protein